MFVGLRYLLGWVMSSFRSRQELLLENLALRQQLLVLHAKRPRPRLSPLERLFWVALRGVWSGWKRSLLLVTPGTVVRWHRTGFRLYWSWISRVRKAVGRKPISQDVRQLILRMVAENPTWGAPRIHGELLKLGFDLSERSVSRWLQRANHNPDPARRWLAFLRNHREAIAAMDFFTVPTLTFGVLYCFFVIGHDRRKILHCNVTRQPNALWTVLQLREAWGYDRGSRFALTETICLVSGEECVYGPIWTGQPLLDSSRDHCQIQTQSVFLNKLGDARSENTQLLSFGEAQPELIFRTVAENQTWGAPRIHGEPLKLGSASCPLTA